MPVAKQPAVVISGYYGYGNMGDEAVLGGIITSLISVIPDISITVLTSNKELTTRLHPGVAAAGRYSLSEIVSSIKSSDIVISGGGSLLQDVTSTRSSYYYLGILQLAGLLRRKRAIYAQGIGPVSQKSLQKSIAKQIRRCDMISVRDVDSFNLLVDFGIEADAIELVADPACLVEPDLAGAEAVLEQHGLKDKQMLAVCLRPWPGLEEVLPELKSGIAAFCKENCVTPVVMPMQISEDLELAHKLELGPVIDVDSDFRVLKGIIAKCRCMVAMRLHSLIFAASEAVPFLAISYDPKVSSFARSVSNTEGIPVADVEQKKLVELLQTMWTDQCLQQTQVSDIPAKMRENALIPALRIRDLLSL